MSCHYCSAKQCVLPRKTDSAFRLQHGMQRHACSKWREARQIEASKWPSRLTCCESDSEIHCVPFFYSAFFAFRLRHLLPIAAMRQATPDYVFGVSSADALRPPMRANCSSIPQSTLTVPCPVSSQNFHPLHRKTKPKPTSLPETLGISAIHRARLKSRPCCPRNATVVAVCS